MSGVRCLCAWVMALLVGCSNAEPPPDAAPAVPAGTGLLPDTQTIDGILVMRHGPDAFDRAPQWTLDSVPEAVIDGGAEFDLTYVYRPVLLADGRAFAVNGIGGGQIRLFDEAGRPARVIARSGQGPGELVRPSEPVLLPGDSLLLADGANRSVNWYTADNGFIRSVPLQPGLEPSCFRPAGRLANGRLVAIGGCTPFRLGEGGASRPPTAVASFALDFGEVDTVAMVPGYELHEIESRRRGGRPTEVHPVRLGRSSSIALVDSLIVLGSGEHGYHLDLMAPTGSVVRQIQVDVPRRLVTMAMRNAVIEQELEQINSPGGEGRVDAEEDRRQAREVPFPDSLPPYGRLLAGDAGTFWVLDYTAPTDTTWSATAFRPDGTLLGRLHGPLRGKGWWAGPVWFGADRVMVRDIDEDGVVRFGVYPIRRGGT